MPTGPLGGPRPFAQSEIRYYIRFMVDDAIGESLESNKVAESAEKLIAQEVEDKLRLRDPAVALYPAGWTVGLEIGTGTNTIPQDLHENIIDVAEMAVKSAVDNNAKLGTVSDEPDWEIKV